MHFAEDRCREVSLIKICYYDWMDAVADAGRGLNIHLYACACTLI